MTLGIYFIRYLAVLLFYTLYIERERERVPHRRNLAFFLRSNKRLGCKNAARAHEWPKNLQYHSSQCAGAAQRMCATVLMCASVRASSSPLLIYIACIKEYKKNERTNNNKWK